VELFGASKWKVIAPCDSALCFLCPLSSCTRSRRWSSPPYTFTWPLVISQQLIGGDVELTHFWKGFGALGGAYVFLALASRGLASQEGRTFAQALHGRAKERVLNRHQHEGWLETNLLVWGSEVKNPIEAANWEISFCGAAVCDYLSKELQTFLDHSPMQRGASFNLDAVKAEMAKRMQQAEAAGKGTGQ
jgi:hypothetical protein